MSAKEKARPAGGTAERAAETAAFGGAAISYDYLTTTAAGRQIKISDYLGHSQESAVTGRELCALTGLDHRTIRAQIEQERRAGALIVADNKSGYWVSLTMSGQSTGHLYGVSCPHNGAGLSACPLTLTKSAKNTRHT